MARDDAQIPLFAIGAADPTVEPLITADDIALAKRLPPFLHFGTSSWSFPGWSGLVWKTRTSEAELARAGLAAYAQQPLFRSVGLDRGYYAPLRREELAIYAEQLAVARSRAPGLPPFRIVSKVWEEITTAVYPGHPRYGARGGSPNPHFLDAAVFCSEVLAPYEVLGPDAGPFVFELTPMRPGTFDERSLVTRVDDFIARLPSGPRWAFELRNAELFGSRWLHMLRANDAAHVFNYWTAMPPLREQLRMRALTTRFTVVRLMLPPYTRYATRKASFAPFDKVVEPAPDMRADVVDILRAAAEANIDDAFVIVNNKAEGSAPLTIRALASRTADALRDRLPSAGSE